MKVEKPQPIDFDRCLCGALGPFALNLETKMPSSAVNKEESIFVKFVGHHCYRDADLCIGCKVLILVAMTPEKNSVSLLRPCAVGMISSRAHSESTVSGELRDVVKKLLKGQFKKKKTVQRRGAGVHVKRSGWFFICSCLFLVSSWVQT